jgi:ABC-type sugar transport systems, permease components
MENSLKIPKTKTSIKKRIFNDTTLPFFLMLPAFLFIFTVVLYPMIKTFSYSFYNYKLWDPKNYKFIGLENYLYLVKNADFIASFVNTLKWVVIILFFQFALGLGTALLLKCDFKFRELIRAIVLIPWVTPSILVALMWVWMYHGTFGVINYVLGSLKLINDYIPWLAQTDTAIYACMLTVIWQGMPFFAIMLIAGLSGIPNELYEAGRVDGTSRLQAFLHITLPSLKNVIFITTMLRVIWIANNVDMIYIMTGGGPASSSLTLSVNAYITAQKTFDFGRASAMSVLLTILLSIVAFVYVKKQNLSGVK